MRPVGQPDESNVVFWIIGGIVVLMLAGISFGAVALLPFASAAVLRVNLR